MNIVKVMKFNYQFVIAFILYILVWIFKDKRVKSIIIVIILCIVMNQSYTVVKLFTSEQLKYEDDVRLANQIADKIN